MIKSKQFAFAQCKGTLMGHGFKLFPVKERKAWPLEGGDKYTGSRLQRVKGAK